jgi:hypothetical protein
MVDIKQFLCLNITPRRHGEKVHTFWTINIIMASCFRYRMPRNCPQDCPGKEQPQILCSDFSAVAGFEVITAV